MFAIMLTMLLVVVLATAVVAYVAYPHRGAQMPYLPRLGETMRKGVDALPTLENQRH